MQRCELPRLALERDVPGYRDEAMSLGINAIPAHIVGQRYLLLGAQPYEAFIAVLDKLDADERTADGDGTT